MRTHAEMKYRPVRRDVSRYGKIENALRKLHTDGHTVVTSRQVAFIVKVCRPSSVAAIMKFTDGITRGKKVGDWVFTGEPIIVQNAKGIS